MAHRLTPFVVALALVSACLFVFGLIIDDFTLRLITKAFPVLGMALLAHWWGRASYARHIMAGLLACAAGDVLLEFRTPPTFTAGMVAFLIGHLLYASAFTRRVRQWRLLELLPFLLWIAWMVALVWGDLGAMRLPVIFYAAAILIMMWRATAMVAGLSRRSPWDWAVMAGAITFAFSDSLISLDRFHASITAVRLPIILTYWAGQALLTASTLSPTIAHSCAAPAAPEHQG